MAHANWPIVLSSRGAVPFMTLVITDRFTPSIFAIWFFDSPRSTISSRKAETISSRTSPTKRAAVTFWGDLEVREDVIRLISQDIVAG